MSEQYSSDEDACICSGEVGGRSSHKRKEIHNEVERRRKDKINIGILRLGELLPDKDPRKQSKNGILERAWDYIIYLKDLNEKLVMDKVTSVEATVFDCLRKQIKALEELNANYVRLLTTAGIPLTSGPEEIWDHKPKKYSLKHLPDKQRALLACTEVKTVLQPCQQHSTGATVPSKPTEPVAPKVPQQVSAAPQPPVSIARDATPGCTLVTQALPSAPVMSTAQPSAVTMFQQQHPLTAVTPTATAGVATAPGTGGVVSQPILVINDQGVPVLQNVVTFQNTSIILNPQGHAMGTRAPGSMVSFAGPDMLPQVHLAAGQSADDFAHSALGGLMQCDPKLKEAKLCGVHHNAATFLSGTGMMMNQPLLSLGAGATVIAGQTAPAPQVPSAFLLPSGQIIPVVTQPQVVSAPVPSAHPLGSQVPANVAATAVSSCSTSLGKVVPCDGTQSYMCREHALATAQNKALASIPSSSGSSTVTASAQHGGGCRKQHHTCPQHSSPSSSKCVAVPDSSKTKSVCSHAASKQALCSIRPKPTPQTPDSSQARPPCTRKGGGKKVTKPSPEVPAKKPRTDVPRSDEESATHSSTCSSTTATVSAQSTEGVSSTSNKEVSPLAADILAQATESIFSCGGVEAAGVNQAAQSESKNRSSASSNDQGSAPAVSISTTVETTSAQAATVTTAAASPPNTSVAVIQSQCLNASVLAEAVCSTDAVAANSNSIEEAPKMKDVFENDRPTQMDAETTSTSMVSTENGGRSVSATEGSDDVQAPDSDRNELPNLSLHSIVMEENIDISPSVSSTTFTESYVSVGANNSGHNTPQGSTKIPDCAASLLCQLTPPSSKSSEDNSKAFVSSTDSLASDQELPLILSIPEDDGHGSLNSNSNQGLSFPSLSPGDQLEHELGNSTAKTVESTSSLSQFVLTPPTPHLPASGTQASVTSSVNKKKESVERSTYAYVDSQSFSTHRNHSEELHAVGNPGGKQDCHHTTRSPQLHSVPPTKLHTEVSCHNFVSNAQPTHSMHSRAPQFSTAPAVTAPIQTQSTSLPGFSTAQGFAASKDPESLSVLDNSGKPPPSPCRMVRDPGRCTTPSKSLSSQFPMSINPYMTTTSFPFPRPDQYTPCTRTPTPQSNTQVSSNTALSCYSAEALIGAQNFLPSSYRLTPPSCAQVPTTQRSSCQQSSRPQISYSAESLIQSQASNPKKDLQGSTKEPGFSNHPGFANRLSYQPQTTTQHSAPHSHQRQLPASTSQQSHLPTTSVSVTDNRSQALPVSTAMPPQPATVHSSYNNVQRSLAAATPSRYPIHSYHPAKEDFPMLPSAPLHTPPLHTMTPHMSQSASSRNHHAQPETSSNPNMFQHQNYPYPNFSLGHRSPNFGTCASRPEVPMTSRAPASCLQATSPRQSHHFGMQVPTSQQQGCLFPSASAAPILPLTTEFGPQCSGPLAPPAPPVFGNLSQHCAQAPHLMNNLIPGPFGTSGNTLCSTSLPPPSAEIEKQSGRREKQGIHIASEAGCPETEKQQTKSKSKKSKPSNTSSHTPVSSISYFPDFRNESHNHTLITLPPPPAPSQKLPHAPPLSSTSTLTSSASPWPHQQQQQLQQQVPQPPHSKPSHGGVEIDRSANISSVAYNPLFRPQSQQNSFNLNLNGPGVPTPHSSATAPPFSHHHSSLHRNEQHSSTATSASSSVASVASGPSISATAQVAAPYTNCAAAVAPSQHVPNFNLSNIFPDIGSSVEQGRASAAAPPPPPPSTHFYPSSRVLHNSFNHILPPPPPPPPTHNNFVHSGHHAPSFSNVIPPLTFPMHEH